MLELFSGTESISKAFRRAGHSSVTVEIDASFNPVIVGDVLNLSALDFEGHFDFIWASVPCTAFSVASIGRHWRHGRPKSQAAFKGLHLLDHTLKLIFSLNPRGFCIENPRGMMRLQPILRPFNRFTVSYCQYGDFRMKPTDIFSNLNLSFKPMCRKGMTCHERVRRSGHGGTQRLHGGRDRAVIPDLFCDDVVRNCERLLDGCVEVQRRL